jgi:ferredoxin
LVHHVVFSPTGSTRSVANHFHDRLGGTFSDITDPVLRSSFAPDFGESLVILSFPVHSQNVPGPIRGILKSLEAKRLVMNITYGGYSFGNVCEEAIRMIGPGLVKGVTVTPVRHAYVDHEVPIDMTLYDTLIDMVRKDAPGEAEVPRGFKNPFASFFEKARTDFNIRLSVDFDLCVRCGKCRDVCPVNAIDPDYDISNTCIRCLACRDVCPYDAINVRKSFFLKHYLRTVKRKTDVIVRLPR